MPKAMQLFFYCAGLAFLFVASLRSYRAHQQWKALASNQGKRYKMSPMESLEAGLYNLGWFVSWSLALSEWWLRAALGALSLIIIFVHLRQGSFSSSDASVSDEASTLHLHS